METDDDARPRGRRTDERTDGPSPEQVPELAAEIVVPRDGPVECTLFVPDAAGVDRMTRWLTATEGSFVGLDEMR